MTNSELSPELIIAQQEIIDIAKKFYADYHAVPSMRALINSMKELYGQDKANSTYLYSLFPEGIAQIISMAGLPKSARCL